MQLTSLFIDRDTLASQVTRNFLGERVFDNLATGFLPANNPPGGGGFLGFLGNVWNATKKFGGFLVGAIFSFCEWGVGGLLRYAIEKAIELANFDWAQSDVDLGKAVEQNNATLITQLGGLIGAGTVWVSSLAISTGLTVKFPVLAGRVALDLAKEGGDTLRGQLTGLLSNTGELFVENIAIGVFAGSRWVLRKMFPSNPMFSGNGGRKPWTFAEAINKTVQNAPGGVYGKAFFSGFADGFFDALLDVAYTISFSLDDHYAAAREAQSSAQSPERIIEVFPDAQSEESIILTEDQDNIEQTLTTYLSTHELVDNRDVGTVVGQPYDEWYGLRPQSRRLTIEFNAKETPPFKDDDNKQTRRVQISITNVKAGISWNDLKLIKRFTWGNYMARGVFDDRRQMTVWGSSASEAKSTLLELAKLSENPIVQVSVSHPEIQNISRVKPPTVVYPVFASMLVRKTVPAAGNTTLIDGLNREMARERVAIWREDPPDGFVGF